MITEGPRGSGAGGTAAICAIIGLYPPISHCEERGRASCLAGIDDNDHARCRHHSACLALPCFSALAASRTAVYNQLIAVAHAPYLPHQSTADVNAAAAEYRSRPLHHALEPSRRT